MVVFVGVLALGILVVFADQSAAYNAYTGSTCAACHPSFQSRGALHDLHLTFINNCGMCHPSNPGSLPVSTSTASDPTTSSCLGCHGRDYGGTEGQQAAGLRLHHLNSGVNSCGGCHPSDPVPAPENVNPVHYGRPDVTLVSACADNLDNDGNLAYDGSDPACPVPVEATSWGRIKSLYE